MWTVIISKMALKDAVKVKASSHFGKVRELLALLSVNPFQNPPPYEKLESPPDNLYSRRINKQHRLVYVVYKDTRIVKIIRMWTHYE